MLRRAAPATATALGTGAAAFYWSDPTTAKRTWVFWTEMAPVIVAYRTLEQKQKVRKYFNRENAKLEDAEWDQLHREYAKPTVDTMRKMLGSYVKLGQFLALRPDIMPEVWTDELRTLESAVPAQSSLLVRETIRQAYGKPVEEVFASFDDKPVGSASIGQVHRATLKDGTPVAVKVQYGAANENIMRTDIRNGKQAFRLLAPEQVAVLDEVEAQFATEFDYRREAQHLMQVRANLQRAGFLGSWWRKGVVEVPEPVPSMCTKDVLVMTFLEGVNLVDGIRALGDRAAARRGVAFEDLKREMLLQFEQEGYPEPYGGPGPLMVEAYRRVDRLRCALKNVGVFCRRRLGSNVPYAEPLLNDFNPPRVMTTLLKVHGHELLKDGLFNGDPHAGNFLLLPDGRIGCIDYGQVKKLTDSERHWLCKVYLALRDDDADRLRALAEEVHMRSRYNLDITRQKMLTFALDRDGRDVTDGLNFQQFLDRMYARDPWDEVVPLVIMPSRMCMFLRGIGLMMDHPVSCVKAFAPIAERVLREEGVAY